MKTLSSLSDMTGRRVLITGGLGHLGRVMAETLAELGASIILLDRPGSDFDNFEVQLTRDWGIECLSIECDLEIETERERAIETIKSDGKGLSCLINN